MSPGGVELALLVKAAILGIVEGLTEFLPISSTGHLIVASSLLRFTGEKVPTFEVAIQTGELDGIAWCGATETYTVGWADVTKYYLTNNISGAWAGSYFANAEKWAAVPEHLKALFHLSVDSSHYYRQHWYWWGEAHYRTTGGKLELTTIPADEWQKVEDEAHKFWDEIAAKSERSKKIVDILRSYSETMRKAGPPYRYS